MPFHDALRNRVTQAPDATLAEHREWLAETHGVVAGLTTIWKALKQLKLTLTKVAPGERTGSPRRGRSWSVLDCRQPELDVTRLIFLDETWAKTNMTRPYGRNPCGTRLVASAP